MTKAEFLHLTQGKNLYLDGATGSNLVKAGMPSGVCPEQWILEHREVMLELQKAYVNAGTDIMYAPTFTANRIKLKEYGLEQEMSQMIPALVSISKEAVNTTGRKVYVAGDLTMTGQQLKPVGNMDLETLIDVYKEQISLLHSSGVDLLIVETMMSLAETRAALIAAKEVCELPVMVSFTFESNGRTLFGTDAETAAVVSESLGACAVGVNCSSGPSQMKSIVEKMASVTQIPIIAKPNAGLPYLDQDGHTRYNMSAEQFVEEMKVLVDAGATILGGCCGTDPEYIYGIKNTYGEIARTGISRRNDQTRFLSSERKTVSFGLNDKFIIVGERINPTGKKMLQAQLKEGNLEKVLAFAQEQEECGAKILDVNMGMSGIDEKEMMLRALEEISGVTNLPISIDSSNIDVLESALRNYPGRALINSISLENEKFEKLIPLAAKYGAMFILLPLSDKGLPENLEEKKQIIDKIYKRALSFGLNKEDIIVDGLVTTIGVNKKAAVECLETISYCKELGFATICGLSNISFGMPERSFINTSFLTLAIQNGLTMAIANPSQELLMGCALAADILLAKNEADLPYIEFAAKVKEKQTAMEFVPVIKNNKKDNVQLPEHAHPLYDAVLKGNRSGIRAITQEALDAGEKPTKLLNDVLLPAIGKVGELFDCGKYFLPQLIAGAEAMKSSIEVLEPHLPQSSSNSNMPVVVIATVEGDIHDIGKNLVALLLRNHGFTVIDLGKDVPKEKIAEAAVEYHAQYIALSALMTTTMKRMEEVIDYVRGNGISAKIIIGGAVTTKEYADSIHADGYAKDAAEAVKLLKQLSGIEN